MKTPLFALASPLVLLLLTSAGVSGGEAYSSDSGTGRIRSKSELFLSAQSAYDQGRFAQSAAL